MYYRNKKFNALVFLVPPAGLCINIFHTSLLKND